MNSRVGNEHDNEGIVSSIALLHHQLAKYLVMTKFKDPFHMHTELTQNLHSTTSPYFMPESLHCNKNLKAHKLLPELI